MCLRCEISRRSLMAGGAAAAAALTTGVAAELLATGTAEPGRMRRFAFRSLLLVGLPAYIVMRVGAQWVYSKEFPGDPDNPPDWVNIGFITADGGAILLLIAIVLAGIATWKSKSGLGKAAGIVAGICLVAWVVTIWAMGAKPG